MGGLFALTKMWLPGSLLKLFCRPSKRWSLNKRIRSTHETLIMNLFNLKRQLRKFGAVK